MLGRTRMLLCLLAAMGLALSSAHVAVATDPVDTSLVDGLVSDADEAGGTCHGVKVTKTGNDGTASNDIMNGHAGDDVMTSHESSDGVCGGRGNDTLYGGQDSDVLLGQHGNDTLVGQEGSSDYCYGGSGTDVYSETCEVVDAFDLEADVILVCGDPLAAGDRIRIDPLLDVVRQAPAADC